MQEVKVLKVLFMTFIIHASDSAHTPRILDFGFLTPNFSKFFKEKTNRMKSRRNFLKTTLLAGIATGLFSPFKSSKRKSSEKIKMLTPDGKLVEIDKSVIEKEIISTRATDNEVLEWMKSTAKKS